MNAPSERRIEAATEAAERMIGKAFPGMTARLVANEIATTILAAADSATPPMRFLDASGSAEPTLAAVVRRFCDWGDTPDSDSYAAIMDEARVALAAFDARRADQ